MIELSIIFYRTEVSHHTFKICNGIEVSYKMWFTKTDASTKSGI